MLNNREAVKPSWRALTGPSSTQLIVTLFAQLTCWSVCFTQLQWAIHRPRRSVVTTKFLTRSDRQTLKPSHTHAHLRELYSQPGRRRSQREGTMGGRRGLEMRKFQIEDLLLEGLCVFVSLCDSVVIGLRNETEHWGAVLLAHIIRRVRLAIHIIPAASGPQLRMETVSFGGVAQRSSPDKPSPQGLTLKVHVASLP